MAILVFILSFVGTEFAGWLTHKYLMHGFLWNLHADHHDPHKGGLQKNDSFALIFAIPSFFSIFCGHQLGFPLLAVAGYGVMAYGFVYFIVHESIIHRRFRFIRGRGAYFRALIVAHAHHHLNRGKNDSKNFGMLIVPPKYFRDSFSRKS